MIRYTIIFVLSFNFCFAQISFNNEAQQLGIDVVCGNTLFGNGVSFYDYDNDGWDDISVATAQNDPIRFYKNINGNFVEQSLNIDSNNWRNKQINWVDIDNDGDNDLFITSDTNINRLYENLGNMILQDITLTSGMLNEVLVTYGASWGDYNNDGFLDVFLSNRDTTIPNVLYKNNGDNTFTLVNNEVGLLTTGTLSFCSAFLDYNNDGYQDIYVANDKVAYSNTMYKNNGDGTFTDVSIDTGTNITIDAMSVTVADIDSDGWMDIYVTNDVVGNVLLKNNGDGTFTDIAQIAGVTMNSVAWGSVFLDADNDSDLDLYVSAEHDGSINGYLSSAFYQNNNDGTFNLINNAVSNDSAISYSNAIGDIDNDGFPEILVNNINHENVFLLNNSTLNENNWIKIKLEGTVSNKSGIGSLIEISVNGEKQYRYTLCGEGYLSQNSASEFFGLGNANNIDYIKVKWLSGIEDIIYNVSINEQIKIVEGSSLSVSESTKRALTIYPNPANQSVNIKSNSYVNEVIIYDLLGQMVVKSKPESLQFTIDISQLQAGTYFLKAFSLNDGETFKVIKL